jgi:hypothetical protein
VSDRRTLIVPGARSRPAPRYIDRFTTPNIIRIEIAIPTKLLLVTVLLSAAIGCGHGEPFTPTPQTPGGPFSQLLPRRITFNV